jgi:hypothetical protein
MWYTRGGQDASPYWVTHNLLLYREWYFGGNPTDYDPNDEVADIYTEVLLWSFGPSRPLSASCCVIVLFILSMTIAFFQRCLTAAVLARFREKPCSLNLLSLELLAGSHRIQQCTQAWYRSMFRMQVYPHPTPKYQDDTSFFSRAVKCD